MVGELVLPVQAFGVDSASAVVGRCRPVVEMWHSCVLHEKTGARPAGIIPQS